MKRILFVRRSVVTRLPYFLFLYFVILSTFYSCSKEEARTEEAQTTLATKVKPLEESYYRTNQPLTVFKSDKDGNPIKWIKSNRNKSSATNKTTSTTCADWDPGMVSVTFLGHTAGVFCEQSANTMVSSTYSYELVTPDAPVTGSTVNRGRVRTSAASWPTFTPASTYTTTNVVFTLISSAYDPVFDATFYKYKVDHTISMRYADWCGFESYKSNLTIEFGCANIGSVTTSYQANAQKFTPDAYQPFNYSVYPSTGNFQVNPLILLCYHQCHFPAYGISDKNEISYRKQGTISWTTIVYTDASSHTITPSAGSGTYELRTRGIVTKSPDIWSDYSPTQTFNVP